MNLKCLKGLTKLESLELSETSITDTGLVHLERSVPTPVAAIS